MDQYSIYEPDYEAPRIHPGQLFQSSILRSLELTINCDYDVMSVKQKPVKKSPFVMVDRRQSEQPAQEMINMQCRQGRNNGRTPSMNVSPGG